MTGPITAAELLRRGIDAELDGRAIEIITRLGFPRAGDPLGIKPCIPVPVEQVRTMLESARGISLAAGSPVQRNALIDALELLLDDQERFVCTVTKAAPPGAAEPADEAATRVRGVGGAGPEH